MTFYFKCPDVSNYYLLSYLVGNYLDLALLKLTHFNTTYNDALSPDRCASQLNFQVLDIQSYLDNAQRRVLFFLLQ